MDQILPEVARVPARVAVVAFAAAAAMLAGCDRPPAGAAVVEAAAVRHPPGYVVDSILPPGEALRRFRVGLDSPASLNGPRSRDALVRQFFAAMRGKDWKQLDALAIDRAEFAYLVFPDSRWSNPPYRQSPDVAWLLFQSKSGTGLTRLVARADRYMPLSYRCPEPAEVDGPLRLWARCVARVRDEGKERELRLFGTIIERDGRYKFGGYNSDL